ncbi:hypothetical protein LNKW23_40890 [Paralimibaculum aggregatum]|uniref:Dienelactone hydrolase domain-containing protein n=1 Tax=Paralimibaculum aggregatum TaxID=3036245 RepID=A0ABQ6LNY9_9RHOB|nr:dienelactone hydrolase family protein [Limibaculum sp. NKW23]GMG84873.1 hypothetical protein LNKW23_40890 [Limibaculum sp. NKW23]
MRHADTACRPTDPAPGAAEIGARAARFRVLLLPLLLAALAACAGPPREVGTPRAAMGDGEEGWIAFASTTPYDFPQMIDGSAPDAVIQGRLLLPEGTGPVRGAVILSHGSGGLGLRQRRVARRLQDAGYAAFAIDHFGPRGVRSTARDQIRMTAQAMLADVMAARLLLASHPRIPAERIGMIGWSKGAITAVLGAVDRLAGYAARGGPERLAFAAAFYPFCGFDFTGERLSGPLLMLLGEADDWTPAAPCLALAGNLAAAGEPVEAVVFPEAPHGFDAFMPVTVTVDRAITVRDGSDRCRLLAGPEGRTETLDGGHRLDSLEGRQAYLAACGERGVRFGGNRAARRAAYAHLFDFLDRALPMVSSPREGSGG